MEHITSLKYGAFYNCSSLRYANLQSCVSAGSDCFFSCTSLKEVNAPLLSRIDDNMFRQCTDLNKVALSSQLNYVGQQSFRYCESLKDIDLSNTVITIIRSAAFHGCKSSSYIILPQTLQQMSEWGTFADCNSLVYIKCLAPTPPSLGSEAFVRTNNCPIYVPDESVNAYKTATNWSAYANRIKPLSELKENF